ncbi:MAG TPA: Trm112 family protein [Thermogutta sp.]|nr:Trm112 family protein [Thermogutta sp.]HOP76527.1 Trm112 family protein [Thermogutta sp.]HPU05628.1 Trm112 family protein [Thermogutta sp.]HPZ81820.1 Trm112 family protein [Thermogutta sp.]HQF12845.1 Trm112 family protein [Thermogutta sp.]
MIDPQLLSLLACPETRQPLSLGDSALLSQINQAIAVGKLRNRANCQVTQPLEAILVRQDGKVGYPVWDGIPTLLIDEGIPLGQLEMGGVENTSA